MQYLALLNMMKIFLTYLNKTVLSILKQSGLKLVVLRCAGFNQVDIPYADLLEIPVLRVPAYSPQAVAEHAQESDFFFHDFSENIIQDDVLTQLISFPNVLITGHQVFFTAEAMTEIAKITFGNVDAYLGQKKLSNRVQIPS